MVIKPSESRQQPLKIRMTSTSPRDFSKEVKLLRQPHTDLQLSPLDVNARGVDIPMLWYYRERLDPGKLEESLVQTLSRDYPVLAGRYKNNGTAVSFSKLGVPLDVVYSDDAIDDVISVLSPCSRSEHPEVRKYETDYMERLMPSVHPQMHPYQDTSVPLLGVKITVMSPGTVVAIVLQHGIADAEGTLTFMKNWSRVYRGLDIEPLDHDRSFWLNTETSDEPLLEGYHAVPSAELSSVGLPWILKIMGKSSCIVPLTNSKLCEWKDSANREVPTGKFVSTDDVITARTWKAFVKVRCDQLDIPLDSDKSTSLIRVVNLRPRLDPPRTSLFPNAHFCYPTVLTVKQVNQMSVAEIAQELKAKLLELTPGRIEASIQCMNEQQRAGSHVTIPAFDKEALTFIITSWIFPNSKWEDVNFEATPLFYQHRFHYPYASIFTPRSGRDGVNVWTSGKPEAIDQFAEALNSD